MDRLLTPNEQSKIPQDAFSIYDWKTALQIESYINDVKKLQDSKPLPLAQEMIKELEEDCLIFLMFFDWKKTSMLNMF